MLLDDFMPVYDFNEIHSIMVQADPQAVFRAIKDVTPAELPLFRTLFWIRSLPNRLAGRGGTEFTDEPILEQLINHGFSLLVEAPSRELVVGHIGQVWRILNAEPYQIEDVQDFLEFDRSDFAKIAMNFYADASNSGSGVKVSTETRIQVTSPSARKKFVVYWRFVHPGSALIRRMWLRAIKRRAER